MKKTVKGHKVQHDSANLVETTGPTQTSRAKTGSDCYLGPLSHYSLHDAGEFMVIKWTIQKRWVSGSDSNSHPLKSTFRVVDFVPSTDKND